MIHAVPLQFNLTFILLDFYIAFIFTQEVHQHLTFFSSGWKCSKSRNSNAKQNEKQTSNKQTKLIGKLEPNNAISHDMKL